MNFYIRNFSEFISQNEIDAAKTVHLDYLNTQGQPKIEAAAVEEGKKLADEQKKKDAAVKSAQVQAAANPTPPHKPT